MNIVDSRSDTRRGTLQRTVQRSVFFLDEFLQFGEFFSENEKEDEFLFFLLLGIFPPFFELKTIKLTTTRPRHFLGHHL
jgi:hypothetical protein